MKETNNEFDYISSNYLNRIDLSLLALNRVGNDELLAFGVFSEPLYELIYAATITGIEEYLHHRLRTEVFSSKEATSKYVKNYNHLKRIKDVDKRLKEDDKDGIENSLFNKQVYHQLDIICQYFISISGINVAECPSWNLMKPIIQNRHTIIHHGARDKDDKRIELIPYDVTKAVELARNFINEVEAAFVKADKQPLIIDP